MSTSALLKKENPAHITSFDTVRGLAALSHRWVELPSIAIGKSLPKRSEAGKIHHQQSAQTVKGK